MKARAGRKKQLEVGFYSKKLGRFRTLEIEFAGELRISEMDDWESQSNGSSDDEDNDNDDERKEKKKKKGKKIVKGKKKRGDGSSAEDEPLEDSDDGDGEGREVDYISSSSDERLVFLLFSLHLRCSQLDVLCSDGAIEAKHELKGVAEEDALRRLLNSDEEEEDEENEEELRDKEDENEELDDEAGRSNEDKGEKKKKKKDKKPRKEEYGTKNDICFCVLCFTVFIFRFLQ